MDAKYYKRIDQAGRNAGLLYKVEGTTVYYKDTGYQNESWHYSEIYLDEVYEYLSPITPEEVFLILL